MKPNNPIRNVIEVLGFNYWQVAEKMGIHENSLYRLLRKELAEADRKRIFEALEQLKAEREAELSKMNNVQFLAN